MSAICSRSVLVALSLALVTTIALRAQPQWSQSSTVASSVANYDLSHLGGGIYVTYESAGNIYVTAQTGNSWSAPTLIGAGSAPSIAGTGGTLTVAYVSSGNIQVANSSGGGWSTTNLGNLDAQRVMVRADGAGTLHLYSEGYVSGNYGRFDAATNSGSGWSSFTNLATGSNWGGGGGYYHQLVLATSPSGSGAYYASEYDNWGGRASWSSKSVGTTGFSANANTGYAWNSNAALSNGALSVGSGGNALFGYVLDGTGYVDTFNGTAWTGGVAIGSASSVAVDCTNASYAVYSSGGNLMLWNGGSNTAVTYLGSSVAGTSPLLFGSSNGTEQLLYLDGSGNLRYLGAVPEPATCAAGAGLLALLFVAARRTRRAV